MTNNTQEVYKEMKRIITSKVDNPDSWGSDMSELECLDMFITCDLWHLVEIENG